MCHYSAADLRQQTAKYSKQRRSRNQQQRKKRNQQQRKDMNRDTHPPPRKQQTTNQKSNPQKQRKQHRDEVERSPTNPPIPDFDTVKGTRLNGEGPAVDKRPQAGEGATSQTLAANSPLETFSLP
ncbi:hypothetical protein MTO96_051527 [Rhipicephalus appendiculatus]